MIRNLHRLEHIALLLITVALGLIHVRAIDFWKFVPLFVLIDLVGVAPAAIFGKKKIFDVLYNVSHSYLVHAGIVGVWAIAAGGFEWAMLAAPIHLSIDRGLYGNSYRALEAA